MTFTSLAPSRSELRQQSIAVLPTPMIKHPLADLVDVAECDRLQPGDADVDAIAVVPAGQFQLFALGRAGTHEHGVEFLRIEQPLRLSIGRIQTQIGAHIHDIADFLVEHLGRQPECRDVGSHQAARHRNIARKS